MMGRRDRQRKNLKRLAIGSGVMAAAGYIVGILTAPKSGRETREDIKHVANDSLSAAEKDLKKLHTELGRAIEEGKKRGGKVSGKTQKELDGFLEKAKDTKEKARELISIIHEGGNTDDQDLKRARQDARDAIDHIRDYLKKAKNR